MIIQISRFSSSALLPSSGGAAVVVVVAWAPPVPSPGTNRLATVVKVMPSPTSAAAATSTGCSSVATTSPLSWSVGDECCALVGGLVSCVVGGAVEGVVGGVVV